MGLSRGDAESWHPLLSRTEATSRIAPSSRGRSRRFARSRLFQPPCFDGVFAQDEQLHRAAGWEDGAEIEEYQRQWKAYHISNKRRDRVEVELKRVNDRVLNRDLEMLCVKVAQEQQAYTGLTASFVLCAWTVILF